MVTDTPKATDTEASGPASGPASGQRDIYELLGIDPGASGVLAQEIYWRRVNAYLDADRAGDPAARAAIAELNEALAIVMDEARRAEYDRAHPRSTAAATGPREPERRARNRSLVVLALVPAIGVAAWAGIALGGPVVGALACVVGLVVLLAAAHWANEGIVAGQSPFRVLHLQDGASVEDVEGAYQAEVNRLILLARQDRSALRRLEDLDDAYLKALGAIARGATATPEARRGGFLSRLSWALVSGVGRVLLRLSRGLVALLVAAVSRLMGALGAAGGAGWAAFRRRDPQPAGGSVDVSHRLQIALKEASERVADRPPGEAPPLPNVKASLVLESAAGNRSVPVGVTPLRIGSEGSCDLVLRRDGVAPEHALAWVRDDVVMLHVIHQGAPCLVNGRQMSWAMLEDGDEVRLGEATFTVSIQG